MNILGLLKSAIICTLNMFYQFVIFTDKIYFGWYKIQSLCENMFWKRDLKCFDNSIFFTIKICFLYLWFKSFNIRCKCCTIECNFTGFKMKMFSLFHQLKKEINSTFTKNRRENLYICITRASVSNKKKKEEKKETKSLHTQLYNKRQHFYLLVL